ncbi:MAG: hypothetical protein FWE82_08910 [Defluviitaleaceae bacterium]|nr:hypothetical protein [Defluviitaleaceae bacterium]
MKVKALKSFSGSISMHEGETGDISREDVLRDLINAGYVAPYTDETDQGDKKPESDVKQNAGKGNNAKQSGGVPKT